MSRSWACIRRRCIFSLRSSSAATKTQIIAATQSVTLIDQLVPEHVWVVEREQGATVFRSLKGADMSTWLDGDTTSLRGPSASGVPGHKAGWAAHQGRYFRSLGAAWKS